MKQKQFFIAMAMLMISGMTVSAGNEAPMLDESLTWHYTAFYLGGGGWEVPETHRYIVRVIGDTIVEGVTYKKVYRLPDEGETEFQKQKGGFMGAEKYMLVGGYIHPAACLREEDGKIFRLCEYLNYSPESLFIGLDYMQDYDSENRNLTHEYPFVRTVGEMHESDYGGLLGHYEVETYDFNNPNIYARHLDFAPIPSRLVNGVQRRWYEEQRRAIRMVEGIGIFSNTSWDAILTFHDGLTGDLIAPIRISNTLVNLDYVENNEGEVVFRNSYAYDRFDLNSDGYIDVEDLNYLINCMVNREYGDKRCDLTGDGLVDIEDVNAVINKLLKQQ